MKTYSIKLKDINKNWHVIDAKDLVLGRLASCVANILRGKDKPTYTPHMDCGDNVIIINAKYVYLSGKKSARKDGKIYYRHTGFPGGIKETTAGKILESKNSERVIRLAVQRMITRNNLGRVQMSNLYIYPGESHPHAGQKPAIYNFADRNTKNIKNN